MFDTFQQPMTDFSAYAAPNGPLSVDHQMDLNKALTAGSDINSPGAVAGGGFPLRPESLDGTLYNLSFSMNMLKLWPQLLKEDVFNTVNEYNVLREHGSGQQFFHGEGGLPGEDDSTWERLYSTIKYMGTTRRYSIVAALNHMAHASAEVHQTLGGTMWILENLEKQLFTGDSSLLPQSFNGYGQQIANVMDLRGRPLTGDIINYGSGYVQEAPNYGTVTDLYSPVGVITDFIDDVMPNARYMVSPDGWRNGRAGMQVKTYDTQIGPIALQPNVFLTFGAAPDATAAGDAAQRPGAPTILTGPTAGAPGAGETSQFVASDAGTYIYRIVAYNAFGRSTPITSAAVVVATGQKTTMTIADGTPIPSYYIVFRSTRGGAAGTALEQFRVARSATGVTTITDLNEWIPGTGIAYMVQQNAEFNKIKRLLRYMKVRLGILDTSYRFMLLLYLDLVVQTPNKGLIFRNVGRANRSPTYIVS